MLLDRELPASLRAATFEVLARVPGVEVSHRGMDANGRPARSRTADARDDWCGAVQARVGPP
jgi:hypothetical protein